MIDYGETDLIRTPDDSGDVQNTSADGPYPYVQPGVDYAGSEEYCETRLISTGICFLEAGRNQFR